MRLMFTLKAFVGWIFAAVVVAFSVGIAAGSGYTMRQADGVIATVEHRYDRLKTEFDAISSRIDQAPGCVEQQVPLPGQQQPRASRMDTPYAARPR